jgi:mRNA-degrading endonuclease RelE of RelBE toxin-antitoxin system
VTSPDIVVADTFDQACERLDQADAKRADAFVDRLVTDPSRAGTHFEIVRKQPDRNMRSARVSLELRAIAYLHGETLTLLWVDHHDSAYRWARAKCVVCHPVTGHVIAVTDAPEAEAE